MQDVTEAEWESFKTFVEGVDLDKIYSVQQYNEFYGLDFTTLKETIGEEKYLYYGFDTWTQADWDAYQEFIKDLYTYNLCELDAKYDYSIISKYPEFKARFCD